VTARSADPDTLVASAKAYVSAINKLMTRRARTKPEALKAG
jgi:2-isopropylmalate synthase